MPIELDIRLNTIRNDNSRQRIGRHCDTGGVSGQLRLFVSYIEISQRMKIRQVKGRLYITERFGRCWICGGQHTGLRSDQQLPTIDQHNLQTRNSCRTLPFRRFTQYDNVCSTLTTEINRKCGRIACSTCGGYLPVEGAASKLFGYRFEL